MRKDMLYRLIESLRYAVDDRRMSEPMRERTDLPGVVLEPVSDKDMLVKSVEKYR